MQQRSPATPATTPVHLANPQHISHRLVQQPEVEYLVAKRKTWIFAELANPDSDFPKPVKVGRNNAWVLSEILAYIDRRVADRDQGVAA